MTGKKKGVIMELSRNHFNTGKEILYLTPLYINHNTGEVFCQEDIELEDGKRNWKARKRMSIQVAKLMKQYDKERANRIEQCGTYLEFVKTPDQKNNLQRANFCRERMCPMCQWRRSIKLGVQADEIYRELTERGYKHVFVTLTVKNVNAEKLIAAVDELIEAAQRFRRSKLYQGAFVGSYRALEITYNARENTYHPHLHYLMTVENDYFTSEKYVKQEDLIKAWKYAARLDYEPSVMIEAVRQKEGQSITSACAEMCKYPVKSAEIKSSFVLENIDKALRGRRLIQWGGIAAQVRKEKNMDDIESGNLINMSQEDLSGVPLEKVVYVWRYGLYVPIDIKELKTN